MIRLCRHNTNVLWPLLVKHLNKFVKCCVFCYFRTKTGDVCIKVSTAHDLCQILEKAHIYPVLE